LKSRGEGLARARLRVGGRPQHITIVRRCGCTNDAPAMGQDPRYRDLLAQDCWLLTGHDDCARLQRSLFVSPQHTLISLGFFPETNMSAHGTIRVEDDQLLRGEGRYADDAKPRNLAMPISCARRMPMRAFKSIDTAEASKAPKVLAVLTARTWKASASVSRAPADDAARRLQARHAASAIARGVKR